MVEEVATWKDHAAFAWGSHARREEREKEECITY
jgi:hypothetical protein